MEFFKILYQENMDDQLGNESVWKYARQSVFPAVTLQQAIFKCPQA